MTESQWYLEVNGQKIGPFALDHIQGLYADGEIKGFHHVTSDQLEGQWITVQELVDSLRIAAPPPPGSDLTSPPLDLEEDSNTNIELPVLEPTAENRTEEASPLSFQSESIAPPPPPESPAEFNSDFQPPPRPADLRSAASSITEEAKKSGNLFSATVKTLPPDVQAEPAPPVNDPALSMMSSLQLFKERQEKTTDTYDPTLVIQSDMLGRGDKSSPPRMWMIAIIAGIILGCISWGVLRKVKDKTKAPPGTMTQISNQKNIPPVSPPVNRPALPLTTNVTPPATSVFRSAEGPKGEQHRLSPPRPLVAPSSAPAPVRQFEPPRDQQPPQIDTAQPNEVPPQPQYAPQYQAYPPPNSGNLDPNNAQIVPQQPYVDPNNPQAPPVYPAGGENFQNGAPPPQLLPPQGTAPINPGMDNFNPPPGAIVPQDPDQQLLQQQQNQQPPAPPQQ